MPQQVGVLGLLLLGPVTAVEADLAVKRVRGMRLVGLAKRERGKAAAAPAVVTNRQRQLEAADTE